MKGGRTNEDHWKQGGNGGKAEMRKKAGRGSGKRLLDGTHVAACKKGKCRSGIKKKAADSAIWFRQTELALRGSAWDET